MMNEQKLNQMVLFTATDTESNRQVQYLIAMHSTVKKTAMIGH